MPREISFWTERTSVHSCSNILDQIGISSRARSLPGRSGRGCDGQIQNVPTDHEWEWGMVCLGRARFGQGRRAEAIQVLSSVKEWGYLAYVYAKSGRQAEAEKLIGRSSDSSPGPPRRASIRLGLPGIRGQGPHDRAVGTPGPRRTRSAGLYPEQSGVRVRARRPASENPAREGGVTGIGFMR